ncbi:MAG: GIY-YIG nuclease family protein [Bacteroidales bacterium]|nr:GIY-YIG nuclease family protein [Bacteroidales bacterium]
MQDESKQGYVYILTNPSFKEDWVKIGKSSRPVDVRSKELDNTAVPLPFEIFATMKTCKYDKAEKLIHSSIERFTNLRVRKNREFFKVKPEEALAIFKEIAEVIDDAEIEETYKKAMMKDEGTKDPSLTSTRKDGKRVWLIPSNSKYFDVKGCFDKYGYVYWSQHFNFQKGDTGYIYSSSPDSAIRFKFDIVETDVLYNDDMGKEIEFYVDPKDMEVAKRFNRFAKLKLTGETNTSRLSLINLIDNGLRMAPRGALNLSFKDYAELKKYIEENF